MDTKDPKPPLEPDHRPGVACPHCGANQGRPVKVATMKPTDDAESVDITMSCRDCRQTWIVQKLTHETPPA